MRSYESDKAPLVGDAYYSRHKKLILGGAFGICIVAGIVISITFVSHEEAKHSSFNGLSDCGDKLTWLKTKRPDGVELYLQSIGGIVEMGRERKEFEVSLKGNENGSVVEIREGSSDPTKVTPVCMEKDGKTYTTCLHGKFMVDEHVVCIDCHSYFFVEPVKDGNEGEVAGAPFYLKSWKFKTYVSMTSEGLITSTENKQTVFRADCSDAVAIEHKQSLDYLRREEYENVPGSGNATHEYEYEHESGDVTEEYEYENDIPERRINVKTNGQKGVVNVKERKGAQLSSILQDQTRRGKHTHKGK